MEEIDTPSSSASLMADALSYPARKWTWWLAVTACGVVMYWLASVISHSGGRGNRLFYVMAVLAAVIVRAYFSTVENTITGYGEKPGESGLRMDEFWETLGRVVLAAIIAWCPLAIAVMALHYQEKPVEPWASLFTALGCEYFPMALLGIVNFGGAHGAMPQVVVPGIFRCGPFYLFAALGLMSVPASAFWIYGSLEEDRFSASVLASGVAAYFLVGHARLIGRIYLANRERLAWE
jgi:hypothetical protein